MMRENHTWWKRGKWLSLCALLPLILGTTAGTCVRLPQWGLWRTVQDGYDYNTGERIEHDEPDTTRPARVYLYFARELSRTCPVPLDGGIQGMLGGAPSTAMDFWTTWKELASGTPLRSRNLAGYVSHPFLGPPTSMYLWPQPAVVDHLGRRWSSYRWETLWIHTDGRCWTADPNTCWPPVWAILTSQPELFLDASGTIHHIDHEQLAVTQVLPGGGICNHIWQVSIVCDPPVSGTDQYWCWLPNRIHLPVERWW